MHLNVFTNNVIGISPLHYHYNVFVMCTHLHICFLLSTMAPFSTCFTTTLIFLVPLIDSNFHTIYGNIAYQFLLFSFIHHPIFHIPCHRWLRGTLQSPSFFLNIESIYDDSLPSYIIDVSIFFIHFFTLKIFLKLNLYYIFWKKQKTLLLISLTLFLLNYELNQPYCINIILFLNIWIVDCIKKINIWCYFSTIFILI
jgi:hypothetical protein